MSTPCEKHALLPVVGQSPCAGCEIERLMAENERLVRRDQMLAEFGCEYCGGSGHVSRIDGEYLGVCDQCLAHDLSCAKHEIDQLKASNLTLHAQVDTLAEWYASSLTECEALRKDAARYRWTAIEGNWVARMLGKWRAHVGAYGDAVPTDWYPSREEAIDAAMTKAPLANPGQ